MAKIAPTTDKNVIVPNQASSEAINKVNTFITDQEKKISAGPEKNLLDAYKTEDDLVAGQKIQQGEADKFEAEKNKLGIYRDSMKALERGEEDFSNVLQQKNIEFLDLEEKGKQYVHNMTFARNGKDYGASLKGMQAVNSALAQARQVMDLSAKQHEQNMRRLGEDYGQGVIEITRNLYRNVDDARMNVYSKLNQMQLTGGLETAEDLRAAHQALADQYTKDLTLYSDTYTRSAEFLYNKFQADRALAEQKKKEAQTINQDLSKLQRVYINGLGQKILDANGKPIPYREDVMIVPGTDGTMYEIDPITKQIVNQYNVTGQVADIEANKNALKNLSQGSNAAVSVINNVTGTYAKNSNTYKAIVQPDGGIKFDTAKYENQSLARGWCGQFVNDAINAGMGDSFESKIATVNKAKSVIPLPGMAFIQNTGFKDPKTGVNTGHTGLIEQVYDYDGDGQPDAMDVVESNYDIKGGISRTTIKKGDARWNQIYKYGFYDPAQGKRTYTNPNAPEGEFDQYEIAKFNTLTPTAISKLTVADAARYNQFLKKKKEVFNKDDNNASIEDIMNFSTRARPIGATELKSIDDSLNSYFQFSQIVDQARTLGTGPVLGKIREWNPYDTEGQVFKTQVEALVAKLARGTFGEVGVLTDTVVERYKRVLPKLQGTKDYNLAVTAYLNRVIAGQIKMKLKTLAKGGADVSLFQGTYDTISKQAEDIERSLGIDSTTGGTGGMSGADVKKKYNYSGAGVATPYR